MTNPLYPCPTGERDAKTSETEILFLSVQIYNTMVLYTYLL